MERPPFKRKGNDLQDGARKNAKSSDAPAKKMSFAERQMQRMGWKKGMGLGANGEGMTEAIEVTVRAKGVGLGAVKEKTAQQKREEKRVAESRGEKVDDSSDEEREAEKRRRKMKKNLGGTSSGTSTPGRAKQKFTIADLPDGLHVPATLRDIYDMTGSQKKITDASGLTLRAVPAVSEIEVIARRAAKDLEAYAQVWTSLSEESETISFQEAQLLGDLDKLELEIDTAQRAKEAARGLPRLGSLDEVLSTLETIPFEYRDETIAVAAVHPLLRDTLSSWDPMENPTQLLPQLRRLDSILKSNKDALVAQREGNFARPRKRTTSPLESLWVLCIMPKLREAILAWTPTMPYAMISLVQSMEPLCPRFVFNSFLAELVAKLTRALYDFNPRLALKRKTKDLPHLWVLPMLDLLPEHLTRTLVSDLKRKLRVMLEYDVTRGPIPGLGLYKRVIPDLDHMLVKFVVPRLSGLVRSEFEVNPMDQDLDPLVKVMRFSTVLSPTILSQILLAEFFPKWFSILHQWLEGEPNYEEVGQFYQWWKSQFPEEVNEVVAEQWEKALHMINMGIDGKLEAFREEVEQAAPDTPLPVNTPSKEPARRKEVQEATFKDIVEDWCGEENLLLIPLREAHPTTGVPLFRITANAIGRGGVVVYMRGDVLYATDKKDKSKWNPIGLGDELVQRAEGK